MADGRKNNGGNKNAGRKSKSEEAQLIERLTPLKEVAFKALADAMATKSAQKWALPLYFGYMYGKPKQQITADLTTNQSIIVDVKPK